MVLFPVVHPRGRCRGHKDIRYIDADLKICVNNIDIVKIFVFYPTLGLGVKTVTKTDSNPIRAILRRYHID